MSSGNDQFEREFEQFLAGGESRLAALYRKLPQAQPDAKLDAAVQAMAHRALNPQLVATPRATDARRRRRGRWMTALGAAAGVVLAAGIAYKLGPSTRGERDYTAPANEVISVRPLDAPAGVQEAPPLSPPPPPRKAQDAGAVAAGAEMKTAPMPPREPKTRPTPETPAPASAPSTVTSAAAGNEHGKLEEPPANAPEAQAFPESTPARKRGMTEEEAVERRETMAEGAWQNLHGREVEKDDRATATRPEAQAQAPAAAASAARAAPAAAPRARESVMATPPAKSSADAATAATARETPTPAATFPATPAQAPALQDLQQRQKPLSKDPNARLYPEHWLANIRTMLKENRRDEALRSLAELRRMYPDYRLPDDLRELR